MSAGALGQSAASARPRRYPHSPGLSPASREHRSYGFAGWSADMSPTCTASIHVQVFFKAARATATPKPRSRPAQRPAQRSRSSWTWRSGPANVTFYWSSIECTNREACPILVIHVGPQSFGVVRTFSNSSIAAAVNCRNPPEIRQIPPSKTTKRSRGLIHNLISRGL